MGPPGKSQSWILTTGSWQLVDWMSAVDRGADEPGAPREQLCLGWSKALRVQSVVPLCLCGLT